VKHFQRIIVALNLRFASINFGLVLDHAQYFANTWLAHFGGGVSQYLERLQSRFRGGLIAG